jgi:hypothetical protein
MTNGTPSPRLPYPPSTAGRPLILLDAYVEVNGINLSCLCLECEITAENKTVTVTTFCGETDYPSITKWHFVAKFAQSYEANGTHDALTSAIQAWNATETACTVIVVADQSVAVSAGNPEWSGKVIPVPINKFGGVAGTLSEVDIDWIFEDEPDILTTWTPAPASAAAKEPAKVPA